MNKLLVTVVVAVAAVVVGIGAYFLTKSKDEGGLS